MQSLIRVDNAIDDLPLLPSALCELMSLSMMDDKYFEKIHVYAEQDPTFAIRIIRLANSVVNAPVSQIISIQHAIARLGTKQIKGLAMVFAVAKVFVPSNKSEVDLWVHSIQVAIASQSIARMTNGERIEPEAAYLCGLLHDIGRFVLFDLVPYGPLKIDEKEWNSPEELIEAEQAALGLNHAKLGAYVAKKWMLPDELINVISNHHNYTYSDVTQVDKKQAKLIRIVQMADYFSVLLMTRPEILSLPPEELEKIIEEKCVHPSWDKAPIKAVLLQNEAKNIYDKALYTVNGLGINIDY